MITAIVVAGGTGDRLGLKGGKQLARVAGAPVLAHTLEAFVRCDRVDAIVVVAHPDRVDEYRRQVVEPLDAPAIVAVVPGGDTRTASVSAGLDAVPADTGIVVVHDGARPLVTPGLIAAAIAELEREPDLAGVVVGHPSYDTLKTVGPDGEVLSTPDRASIWAAQTPQVFRVGVLREAYRRAGAGGWVGTDDASLVEHAGGRVRMYAGPRDNMKVTVPEDLPVVDQMLRSRRGESIVDDIRVGMGYDVHAFAEERPLVLGGVSIPHGRGLAGHSDADVLVHALMDAILGAMREGDIGGLFPDTDPAYRGISSIELLERVASLMGERGFILLDADTVLILEQPKMAPYRDAMRGRIARALRVGIESIGVKATTTERLGFTGREEGVAAQAVVLLRGPGR